VDPKGRPYDEKDWVVKFAGEEKDGKYTTNKWVGDVPDGGWFPLQNPDGTKREDGRHPFIMTTHGHGQIFGPGLADGPFPEHYEPIECPVEKNMFSSQMVNPTAVVTAPRPTPMPPVTRDSPLWEPLTGYPNIGRSAS